MESEKKTQESFFDYEIDPKEVNSKSPRSLGRNGEFVSLGVSIKRKDNVVELAPHHSRGEGRSFIQIPKDPDLLWEMGRHLMNLSLYEQNDEFNKSHLENSGNPWARDKECEQPVSRKGKRELEKERSSNKIPGWELIG